MSVLSENINLSSLGLNQWLSGYPSVSYTVSVRMHAYLLFGYNHISGTAWAPFFLKSTLLFTYGYFILSYTNCLNVQEETVCSIMKLSWIQEILDCGLEFARVLSV